jgi:hypothetical protein
MSDDQICAAMIIQNILLLLCYLQIRKKRPKAPNFSEAFLDALISMNAVADVGVRT